MLTKGNFTRDEWNHLLCLFNISHFSSTDCSEAMSKRTQKDSGEERVTANSKPMMNLVSRCRVRDPNVRASTASESPGKTNSESQKVPLSSLKEQQPSKQLGKFLHGGQLSLVNDEEVISLSHAKVLCILRFCVMSWKGESEPGIKYCLGRTVELVQRFTTIQNFGHKLTESRWDSSGILSQDSPHCSSSTKTKSYCQDWA